jgi:hypothetical protein
MPGTCDAAVPPLRTRAAGHDAACFALDAVAQPA